jgi:hypothetical protein
LALMGHVYLSGMWFGAGAVRRHMFTRDWTACLKYVKSF